MMMAVVMMKVFIVRMVRMRIRIRMKALDTYIRFLDSLQVHNTVAGGHR